MKTFTEVYEKAVLLKGFSADTSQKEAVSVLAEVYDAVVLADRRYFKWRKPIIDGVYLYGAVGAGKTFLLDLFFEALPTKRKQRLHFYQFMQMVHADLKRLEGTKNPLKVVARDWAKKTDLICFDEFFVVNIVDAMLLGCLLEALYQEKVLMLMTSNVFPDELYQDGLQRERFLPAIDLIKRRNKIVKVGSGIDYRLTKADYERAYFYPQDSDLLDLVLSRFRSLARSSLRYQELINLDGRLVQTLYIGDKAIWFDFKALCSIPRSQRDYLLLSQQYPYIFVSNVRQITVRENDLICNFIKMVDVFYDAKTKLYLLASVPLGHIYPDGEESFAFERTQSRLMEMQSPEYLQAESSFK